MASDLVDIRDIYSTQYSFAAVKTDGTVVTWGHQQSGGDSSSVTSDLVNVRTVVAANHAFAAHRADGSVVTWGSQEKGGDSSSAVLDYSKESEQLEDVLEVVAASGSFVALQEYVMLPP